MKPYIANSLARPSPWSSQLNCKVNAGAPWRGQVGHRGDGVRAASSQAEALPVRVGWAVHSCPSVLYVQANGDAPALTTTHAPCKPGPGLSRRLWVRRTVRSSVPCTMCLPPSMCASFSPTRGGELNQAAGWEKACECVCRQVLGGKKRQHTPVRQSLK